MTMIVMGGSLLIVVFVLLLPITLRQRGIRDLFWGMVVCVLLGVGALGMLAEGFEQMGWFQ
jgi:hypothetical protein